MDRTPLVNIYGPAAQALFARNIASYNAQLAAYISSMPMALGGTQAVLFSTGPFFNQILDAPMSYGFQDGTTCGLPEAPDFCTCSAEISFRRACPDYLNITDQPDINLPDCPWPVSYLNIDSYEVFLISRDAAC